jgi:hypothetical protein
VWCLARLGEITFGAWYNLLFLCLVQIDTIVPGTNTTYCAWHSLKVLYPVPIPDFTPGTLTCFRTWYKQSAMYQVHSYITF